MQVRAHYRTVPYHNFFHCVDVTHATFRHAIHLCLACFLRAYDQLGGALLISSAETSIGVGQSCLLASTALLYNL